MYPSPLPAARDPRPPATPPLADRSRVRVHLRLSTPLSVVVQARLELGGGAPDEPVGLVFSRADCQGDQPSGRALLHAAHAALQRRQAAGGRLARLARLPRRLLAEVDGHWLTLVDLGDLGNLGDRADRGAATLAGQAA